MSLNRVPMQMITPRIVADVDPTTGGILIKYSDGTTKVVQISGGGEVTSPEITINGGQTANVQPNGQLAVRVQNVPSGSAITWAGTGSSTADPLIASLTSGVGSSSGNDFTVNVPVGSALRTVTFTASVAGQLVATFTATVSSSAVDFQLADLAPLSFAAGSTTGQNLTAQITGIVGNVGTVNVTFSAGSSPVTTTPASLALSSGTPSGTTSVKIGSAATSGSTYTLTATATNGTVTRTKTCTITVTAGSGQYVAPVLTFLTEAGMPSNEVSVDVTFGFRVENVYTGSGAVLKLLGWNAGPSNPGGTDFDITALTDSGSPYYNATTKVFEYPISAGLRLGVSSLETSPAVLNSNGGTDRSITGYTLPMAVSNKAPDGQTRTSNVVNVAFKRACAVIGPLDGSKTQMLLVGGTAGSVVLAIHAPKYSGQTAGMFQSANAYAGCIPLGTISGNTLNANLPYSDLFADAVFSVSGMYNTVKFMTYTGSSGSASGTNLFAQIPFICNPNGAAGGNDVPPPLSFSKRNASIPIDHQWVQSNGTPLYQSAVSGSFGSSGDSNVRQDNDLVVNLSTLGSQFKLAVRNLALGFSGSGTPQTLIAGCVLMMPENIVFNEMTNTSSSASGTNSYWGASLAAYSAQNQEFTYSTAQLDAFFAANPFSDRVSFNMSVGGRDPNGICYIFRHVSLTVLKG